MNIQKFKKVLKRCGKTQGDLAADLGISSQVMSYRCANDAWKYKEVEKIAAILGLSEQEKKEIFS